MSDSLSSRFSSRSSDSLQSSVPASTESDGTEDLGSFGWLRGVRERSIMLELRRKNGSVLAIGYGWIERVEFDPADGITLHASGRTIRIRGLNLNTEARPQVRLFQGLTRHRVSWIQEADHASEFQADQRSVVVKAIEW